MRTYAYLGLIAALGCSSPSNSGGPLTMTTGGGNCADRAGTYRQSYVERSGSCGAVSEVILTIDPANPPRPGPACRAMQHVSGDNCTIDFDVTCPAPVNNWTVTERGIVHWSQDGAHGTGSEQAIITDTAGGAVCSSTYDLTIERL